MRASAASLQLLSLNHLSLDDLLHTHQLMMGEILINAGQFRTKPVGVYKGKDDLPNVINGLGIAVISTSNGLMTDRAARKAGHAVQGMCDVA